MQPETHVLEHYELKIFLHQTDRQNIETVATITQQ